MKLDENEQVIQNNLVVALPSMTANVKLNVFVVVIAAHLFVCLLKRS